MGRISVVRGDNPFEKLMNAPTSGPTINFLSMLYRYTISNLPRTGNVGAGKTVLDSVHDLAEEIRLAHILARRKTRRLVLLRR